jgi:hypothetical protein
MCQVSKLKIKKKCRTPNDPIVISIVKDGEQLDICKSCWERIGSKEWEVGDSKVVIEKILGRRVKEEAEATPTEYDPFKKFKKEEITEEEEYSE